MGTVKTTGISPELSYYRRVTATKAGRARIALMKRTRRRLLKRLKDRGLLKETEK